MDLAMMALALMSVGLLLYVELEDPPLSTQQTIFQVDLGVCAVFAIEFLWRWRRDGWSRRFLVRNWYEILGMIPVSHPALRSFRLLRLVRVVVVLVRLGMATDRALGEEFTIRLLQRVSNQIVEAIKRPVTVAVIDEVLDVMRTGDYAQNIAGALSERQEELRRTVLEKLKDDPAAGRLSIFPLHDAVVDRVVGITLRVVLEVLTDPRTEGMVAEAILSNVEQIRHEVRHRELGDPEPASV